MKIGMDIVISALAANCAIINSETIINSDVDVDFFSSPFNEIRVRRAFTIVTGAICQRGLREFQKSDEKVR